MVSQDDIMEKLRQTECPAFWKLESLESKNVCMYDKLSVKYEEIAGQLWRNIVLQLAISYECMVQDVPVTSEASQNLHDCLVWIDNAADNSFVKKYETALRHLVQSFRAFVALKKLAYSEATRAFNNVIGLTEMSKSDLAAVYGIKGNIFAEYGIGGTKEAFKLVRQALKLDDSEPEWHFLLGKLHARWRHFALLREPPEEEVRSLEKAYELLKAPHTAVYLADNVSERCKFMYFKQPLERGKRVCCPQVEVAVRNLNQRALRLYNEAMELNQDQCVHIMIRCARGFISLPAEFKNIEMALELADKAAKKAPGNPMLLATLSVIYKCTSHIGSAIFHASRSADAGVFGSYMMLMNLLQDFRNKVKTEKDKEVDIAAKVEKGLKEFPKDIYRLQLFIYGANYFLFVKRDLYRSLPYFEEAVELDSKFNLLKDRYVRWVKVYLNLFELMFNEIECAISKESFADEREKQMLFRVREKIIVAWPDVVNMRIERDLVNKLKENRFPFNRGRTRTRKNMKKDPKKRKTGKKNSKKRLKSAMSLSAHSKELIQTLNKKIRSSSDDRAFQPRSYVNGDFQKNLKRPLSHGRSQSREDTRKKLNMVDLDKLKKSMTDLSISDADLKPECSASKWGSGVHTSLEKTLSQMTLGPETTNSTQRGKPNFFSKRSGSFDRQSLPQKKVIAEKLLDDRNIHSFLPSFLKPAVSESATISKSTVQYGSLTVANVEKLGNRRVTESRESLDSDDTLNSQGSGSELSLQKSITTEQSVSSISMTTKRSVSLDSSRCPVLGTGAKSSESWADLCENDPYVLAGTEEGPAPKDRNLQANPGTSQLVNSSEKVKRGPGSLSVWNQEQTISDRLRDLSLEKKQRPSQNARGNSSGDRKPFSQQSIGPASSAMNPFGRPVSTGRDSHVEARSYGRYSSSDRNFGDTRGSYSHRPPTACSSYDDRRSPFGRQPSTEGRVLKPPGLRPNQRSDSESSVSSVGSDYVASRWSARGHRNYRH